MSEAKEYLGRIQQADKQINRKLEQLTTLNSMVMRITPVMKDGGGSGGTGGQDKLGNAVAKIADLQEEINRDVDIFVDMKLEAYSLLNKIRDENHYEVLEMRYMKYMSFEQIAVEKHKSRRWAEIRHGRALEVFDKVLKEYMAHKRIKDACDQIAVDSQAANRALAQMANKAMEDAKRIRRAASRGT